MYLQLAESNQRQTNTVNPYIFVPDFEAGTGGVYIREDKFDSMPDKQWSVFTKMLAPYQPETKNGTLSESMFLASRADRRERRKRKKEAKVQKKEAKVERRKQKTESKKLKAESKAELRRMRGEAKMTRAEGKRLKGERGGGGGGEGEGFDWKSAADTAGGLIGKIRGGGAGGEEMIAPEGATEAKPFYKNPIVIGGGVLLLAGIAFMALRPKKTA